MKITSIKQLNSRLKAAGKDNVKAIVTAGSAFVAEQVNENRNCDPLTTLYVAIPTLATKPKGVTQSNLRKYAEEIGLRFDSKRKVFGIDKSKNLSAFEANWFERFVTEPVKASLEDRAMANLVRAIKQYRECGLDDEAVMQKMVKAFELAQF